MKLKINFSIYLLLSIIGFIIAASVIFSPTAHAQYGSSVILSGRVLATNPWSSVGVSGAAPLNGVDLRASVIGGSGSIRYQFDCTNNATYEHDFTTILNPYSVNDLCDYATAGSYTARVRITRGIFTATDTLPITVTGAGGPTPPPGPPLSVELSGRVNSADLWSIHKVNGDVPLNDVDLQASVIGGSGSIQYRFDCTNDGSYEQNFTTSANPYSVADLCDYSSAGAYTVRVRVDSGGRFAEDFLPINVDSNSSLSVAIEGRVTPADPWLTTEVSGPAPLNNVDFRDTVTGGSGSIQYRFDCTNDSTYEHNTTTSTNPYSVLDLCDYPTASSYIARTRTDNGGLEAYDSLTITVSGVGGGGSSISGRVYVDANKNGAQDCSGVCDNGPGDERGYSGASISVSGIGVDTTNSLGEYSFSSLTNGSYTVALTVPPGYTATTTNPVTRSVPPNAAANFGLGPNAPVCTSLESSEPTVPEGGSLTLTATGCSPPVPTPTYSWPPPTCIPPGNCGTVLDVNDPSTTYTAPDDICEVTTVTASVDVTNPEGTNRTSTDISVTPRNVISGAVLEDTQGNSCASGATPYGVGAVVTVYDGGSRTGFDAADGSGSYLVTDNTACGNKTAVISSIPNYHINAVRFDGGAWSTSGFSGFNVPFDFSDDHTLDFCISNVTPWFQTTTGDVRMPTLTNRVPLGNYASIDPANPSVFYSSSFASNFLPGESSIFGWKVDDEYSYRKDSKNRNGTVSYSFFNSRAQQKNVVPNSIPGCSGSCATGVTNLATGVYKVDGDLTITSYSHASGAHVLILVSGNVFIQSNIRVPAGANNLLIIAAKGDVNIAKTVGEAISSSTTPNIEGTFTAEGKIVASGDTCPAGSPDKRLNVAGSIIANALKPLNFGGSGSFINQRSLCTDDKNYPSVSISDRYDFVTQLTDFYKTPYTRWREVAP